jgi:hypothetical protein
MSVLQATFKVHKVEPRGVVNGSHTEERVTLHPTDPHEDGSSDMLRESQSGSGKIRLTIDEPNALGRFKPGQLVEVSFDIPD